MALVVISLHNDLGIVWVDQSRQQRLIVCNYAVFNILHNVWLIIIPNQPAAMKAVLSEAECGHLALFSVVRGNNSSDYPDN